MDVSLLQVLISIFVFHLCKSQDSVTEVPLAVDFNVPAAAVTLADQEITESALTAQGSVNARDSADTHTEAPQATEAEEKELTPTQSATYLPPESQGFEIVTLPEERDAAALETGEAANDLAHIITPEDQLAGQHPTEAMQTEGGLGEVILETPSFPASHETNSNHGAVEAEGINTDDESWRIGAIAAVASIALVAVIAIYCRKFRKRTIRQPVPVKDAEDSEAGETINGESNQNTLTGADAPLNQNVSNESSYLTVSKQEETLPDISLDIPIETDSSQERSQNVTDSIL